MAKNRNTFEKRRREMQKKQKADEKRERRRLKKEQNLDTPAENGESGGDSLDSSESL